MGMTLKMAASIARYCTIVFAFIHVLGYSIPVAYGWETPPLSEREPKECIAYPTLECVQTIIGKKVVPHQILLTPLEEITGNRELSDVRKCESYKSRARDTVKNHYPWDASALIVKEARRRFMPDAKWHETLAAWKRTAEKLSDPERSDNFIEISKLYEETGRIEDAKEAFKKIAAPS